MGLDHQLGSLAGGFFAIVLLNASLIGAGALTLSTSYAFGDLIGTKSSLHRSFSEAKGFYALFTLMVVCAAGIVLIPHAPLGLITLAVQALAGILLPSASMFLLLLCNDRAVLGPWRNGVKLNILATLIVAVLVLLSLILMATTLFPKLNVTAFSEIGGAVLVGVLLIAGVAIWRGQRGRQPTAAIEVYPKVPKQQWTMPPLALLSRPPGSTARKLAMFSMEAYLLAAAALLIVKAVGLSGA